MYAAQPLKVWPQSVRLRTLPSWSQKERACIFSRKSVATGFIPDSVSVYTLFNPSLGFPGGSDGKESTCDAGDVGSIPGLGRAPGKGSDNPFQYSCPGESHGQRSLAGYSPWDCKELDVTEHTRMHHTVLITVAL